MSEIQLLTGYDYGCAVQSLLNTNSRVDAAVSYWSETGLTKLCLLDKIMEPKSLELRVICDLGHIACHWKPIEKLRSCNLEVKKIDGLHAKVWIGTEQLILGSANCSNAALHLADSNNQRLNFEAGLLLKGHGELKRAREWFSSIWDQASHVNSKDIKKKKKKHKKEPSSDRIEFTNNLRPFKDLVGRSADTRYRQALDKLEFGNLGGPGNKRILFNQIQELESFSMDLINAIRNLVHEAEDLDTVNTPRKPFSGVFSTPPGDRYEVFFKKMAAFIARRECSNLWLKKSKRRQDGKHSFSLRLNSHKPKMGHFAVLTIYPDRIDAAEDRSFESSS